MLAAHALRLVQLMLRAGGADLVSTVQGRAGLGPLQDVLAGPLARRPHIAIVSASRPAGDPLVAPVRKADVPCVSTQYLVRVRV